MRVLGLDSWNCQKVQMTTMVGEREVGGGGESVECAAVDDGGRCTSDEMKTFPYRNVADTVMMEPRQRTTLSRSLALSFSVCG